MLGWLVPSGPSFDWSEGEGARVITGGDDSTPTL